MPKTIEILERNLALTVERTMFTSDEVADMLLDIQQSFGDGSVLVDQ